MTPQRLRRFQQTREWANQHMPIPSARVLELFQKIDALRAEVTRLNEKYDFQRLVKENETAKKCLFQVQEAAKELTNENQSLRERVAKLREFLLERSKRSRYYWSPGGDYNSKDHENTGQMICAIEALARDSEEETTLSSHSSPDSRKHGNSQLNSHERLLGLL